MAIVIATVGMIFSTSLSACVVHERSERIVPYPVYTSAPAWRLDNSRPRYAVFPERRLNHPVPRYPYAWEERRRGDPHPHLWAERSRGDGDRHQRYDRRDDRHGNRHDDRDDG